MLSVSFDPLLKRSSISQPFSLPSESLYRPGAIPPIKVLCYAAIVDLFRYLPISKEQPNDLDVRQKLLIAAWMSLWPTRLEKHG